MLVHQNVFGVRKVPLWAARRHRLWNGLTQIALVHLKTGYVRKIPEDHLRNCGVELGNFVSADLQGDNWINYSRIDIPGITPNVEGDVSYAENITATFTTRTIHSMPIFANELFPFAICHQPAGLEEGKPYTIRINVTENFIPTNNNKKINLEGHLYQPVALDQLPQQVRQAAPPAPPSSIGSFPLPPTLRHSPVVLASPITQPFTAALPPVPDTKDGIKRLFWVGKKEFNKNGTYYFVCVLLGTEYTFKINEQANVALGKFFSASIVDGEPCDFEEALTPAGWTVEVDKPEENLATITSVISITGIENVDGKSILHNDTLGFSLSNTTGLRGKYTHEVYCKKDLDEPHTTQDKTILFEARHPKRVRETFKAVVVSYNETPGRRNHDVLIIEKNIKCQFTDGRTKLQKLHFFEGEFEEDSPFLPGRSALDTNGGWTCVRYVKGIDPQIDECTMTAGKYSLQINFENP